MGSVLNPRALRLILAQQAGALKMLDRPLSRATTAEKVLPLPLVAREQSLHRPRPSLKLALARRLAHVALEAMLQPPVVGEFYRLGIDAGGKPREIGGAKRGGLLDHRAIDRRVQQIGEA